MKLLQRSKRRSRISDVAYVGLNIGLVLLILFAILSTQTVWLALILVLLSKWRIFAVRPRFWYANILANMVDVIVGASHVILLSVASGALWLQIVLSIAYALWMLTIKPQSKRIMIGVQAATAVFVGTTALAHVAYNTDASVFVIGMWVIGFVAARHVLMSYDEEQNRTALSLVWAFVMAELGWLGFHWLFAYTLPNSANLKFVQLALIATLLSFVAERTIASHYRHGRAQLSELVLPIAFSAALIAIVVLFFNNLVAGGSL